MDLKNQLLIELIKEFSISKNIPKSHLNLDEIRNMGYKIRNVDGDRAFIKSYKINRKENIVNCVINDGETLAGINYPVNIYKNNNSSQ